MKLLTKTIREKLKPLGAHAQDENWREVKPVVKFFNPSGAGTWYATEFDGVDTFFGLVDLHEKELGYFSLRELEGYKGPFGLGIERDLHWTPKTLGELL